MFFHCPATSLSRYLSVPLSLCTAALTFCFRYFFFGIFGYFFCFGYFFYISSFSNHDVNGYHTINQPISTMRCYKGPLLAFSLMICLVFSAKAKTGEKKPNFLILFIDDLGETDIGVYGNEFIDTPVIDNLAKEGMLWTNAYSTSPVSSPSRAAILTGKNAARVNFTGHITAIGRHRHPEKSRIVPPKDLMFISRDEVILPKALKPAGYTSISIGKWHVGPEGYWPHEMGFDINIAGWTHGSPPAHFHPYKRPEQAWNPSIPFLDLDKGEEGEYLTDRLTDEAIAFIRDNRDNPFLVYLTHYAVHTPLEAPQDLIDKYKPVVEGTPIDPVYAAMVESVDQNTGRLLQVLDELGLAENTVVIFASDNGADERFSDMDPYRAGKGILYEGGLRVPFIMRWPGVIPAGSVSHTRTITEDIYATIVDIVGEEAKPGEPLDGRSLVTDFIYNHHVDRELYFYYPHYSPQFQTPGAAVISGNYKFLEFYDPERTELYNLAEDPGETTNLVEEYPQKIIKMQSKLNKWLLRDVNAVMHTPNPAYRSPE